MKKHLNTLFVTTQGAYLAKEGETVAVRIEGKVRLRLPVHTLDGIVCFGNVGCSPFLLGFCGERNLTVSFLTEYLPLSGTGARTCFRQCDPAAGTVPSGR